MYSLSEDIVHLSNSKYNISSSTLSHGGINPTLSKQCFFSADNPLNKNCQAATPVTSSKIAKRLHTAFRIPLE